MERSALIGNLKELREKLEDPSKNAYEGRNLWDHQQVYANWQMCMEALENGRDWIDALIWEIEEATCTTPTSTET